MLFASHGAINCPFLTFIIFPVFTAALIISLCLQRNAGICIISIISDTSFACDALCISVVTGILNVSFTSSKILRPESIPGPRKEE